ISSGARIRRPNSDTEADPSTGPRLQMDPARSCASPSRPRRVPAKQSPPDEERQAADDEGCDGLGSTTKPTAPEGFPGQQDAGEQSQALPRGSISRRPRRRTGEADAPSSPHAGVEPRIRRAESMPDLRDAE